MCGCLVLFIGSAFPRVAIVLLELFSDYNARAFEDFWVGFLGFLFLPYTTLLYVLMENWQDGINGFGWFVVVFGFLLDVGHYFGASGRREDVIAYRTR
jgi:hypothetical protein